MMINKILWKTRGVMALMSVLVVSFISMVIATSLVLSYVWESRVVTESMNALNAYYLAHGCMEEGLMRIRRDLNYSGESLTLDGSNQCTVSINNTGGNFVLTAIGESYTSTQTIKVNFTIETENNLRDEVNNIYTRHNIKISNLEKS